MLVDLISVAIDVAFVAALVVVLLGWRWPEQRTELLQLAGWIGLAAALGGLAVSLILVLDPELVSSSVSYVILFVMTLFVPLLTLAGALMVLRRKRRGVRLLAAGCCLWLLNVCLGYAGSVFLK